MWFFWWGEVIPAAVSYRENVDTYLYQMQEITQGIPRPGNWGRWCKLQQVMSLWDSLFSGIWMTEMCLIKQGGWAACSWNCSQLRQGRALSRMWRSIIEVLLKISILGTHTSPFCSVQLKVNKTVFPGLCSSFLLLLVLIKKSWHGQRYLQDIKTGQVEKQIKTLQYPLKTMLNRWGKKNLKA